MFYCDLKEKYTRRNINCKKKRNILCKISITIIILICQKLGSVVPVQQKIKLPSSKGGIPRIYDNNFRVREIIAGKQK